ncbi:PcfJ domain-containing protein [uncultured Bacteroides sp.]|uniref:PcfJ domain-containing protein n=1 Tax=uncultured Bacteroides sp. TaxID=162156 RepID=UPI00280A9362|nr:PcfJ domain-containing protein [uncultured Bacteroides sp.]
MKPRTKRERLVAELSSKLPAITDAQIRWGKKHCFPHNAYRCKDEMWCSECGKMWVDVTGQKEGYIRCPYCGERLEVKVSRKTKDNAVSYLTVVTTSGDFQVLRHFYTVRYARKGRDTHYFTDEVCQQWITADCKDTVIAKAMNMWSTSWIHTTEMSIKQDGNIYCSHSYDIDGYVYPKVNVLPILRRNGLRTSFHGVTPAALIRALLGERKYAEMLLKTKQYGMLYFYMNRGGISYPWVVNICNRNGYIIKDGSMYDDYIHLLDYFHLDTHNAHYVCPKNLKKEHDKLVEKKRKIIEMERMRRERALRMEKEKRLKKNISSFWKKIQPFLGMKIKEEGIIICPLESVTQYYQEGKKMHHCVYECSYFERNDSIVLSARKDGKRLETIEVNLNTFKIVQSRGACNGYSKYHNQIIHIVEKNMAEIIRRAAS